MRRPPKAFVFITAQKQVFSRGYKKEHRLSFTFFKGSGGPAVGVIAAVLFFVLGIGGYIER